TSSRFQVQGIGVPFSKRTWRVIPSLNWGPSSMWLALRRSVTALAIYTIAVHSVLWGIETGHSAPAIDPFSVICHSETSAPANPAPFHQGPLSPAVCDHCTLCSAATSLVPPETFIARLEPLRTFKVLRPVDVVRHDAATVDAKLARGPPVFA